MAVVFETSFIEIKSVSNFQAVVESIQKPTCVGLNDGQRLKSIPQWYIHPSNTDGVGEIPHSILSMFQPERIM